MGLGKVDTPVLDRLAPRLTPSTLTDPPARTMPLTLVDTDAAALKLPLTTAVTGTPPATTVIITFCIDRMLFSHALVNGAFACEHVEAAASKPENSTPSPTFAAPINLADKLYPKSKVRGAAVLVEAQSVGRAVEGQ